MRQIKYLIFFIMLFFYSLTSRGMSTNDLFKLRLDILDGKYDCEITVRNTISYYNYETKTYTVVVNNQSSHILFFDKKFDKRYLVIGKYFESKSEAVFMTPCYVFALLDKNMNIIRQIRTPFTPDNNVNISFDEDSKTIGTCMPYFVSKYLVKNGIIIYEQGNVLPKSFWINTQLTTAFQCLEKPISIKKSLKLRINYYSNHKETMLSYGNNYFQQEYVNVNYKHIIFPTEYY